MIKKLLFIGGLCIASTLNAQQLPNGDLESWTDSGFGYEDPDGFVTLNIFNPMGAPLSVVKTTTAYEGTYAAEISAITADIGSGSQTYPGIMMTSLDGGNTNAIPYTDRPDSIVFWYKYAPQGGDMGVAIVELRYNGTSVAYGQFDFLDPQATFTRASIAFNYSTADIPDSLSVGFVTSVGTPVDGSMLTIDGIEIFSSAGLNEVSANTVTIFPNPANETIQVSVADGKIISIYNSVGAIVETISAVNNGQTTLNVHDYADGIYVIKTETGSTSRFVVQH